MPKVPHRPVRTCVACRQEVGKGDLVRFVRGPSGHPEADPSGRKPGRGAYLHDSPDCMALAAKRRLLEKALRVSNSLRPA